MTIEEVVSVLNEDFENMKDGFEDFDRELEADKAVLDALDKEYAKALNDKEAEVVFLDNVNWFEHFTLSDEIYQAFEEAVEIVDEELIESYVSEEGVEFELTKYRIRLADESEEDEEDGEDLEEAVMDKHGNIQYEFDDYDEDGELDPDKTDLSTIKHADDLRLKLFVDHAEQFLRDDRIALEDAAPVIEDAKAGRLAICNGRRPVQSNIEVHKEIKDPIVYESHVGFDDTDEPFVSTTWRSRGPKLLWMISSNCATRDALPDHSRLHVQGRLSNIAWKFGQACSKYKSFIADELEAIREAEGDSYKIRVATEDERRKSLDSKEADQTIDAPSAIDEIDEFDIDWLE